MHTHSSTSSSAVAFLHFHPLLWHLSLGTLCSDHCLQALPHGCADTAAPSASARFPPHFPLTCKSLHCTEFSKAPTQGLTSLLFYGPIGLRPFICVKRMAWNCKFLCAFCLFLLIGFSWERAVFYSYLSCPCLEQHGTK